MRRIELREMFQPVFLLVAVCNSSCLSKAASGDRVAAQAAVALTQGQVAAGSAPASAAEIDRVLVAERGALAMVAMVARDGCVATMEQRSGSEGEGDIEELHLRCPKNERIAAWFSRVESLATAMVTDSRVGNARGDASGSDLPRQSTAAAEFVTKRGEIRVVQNPRDAQTLANEVRALSRELAGAEHPAPGPASVKGWEMLHVGGTAHVMLRGVPTSGRFEAHMSTSGQYLCEFETRTGDGPLRASKSGRISSLLAARAIDDVLGAVAEADRANGARDTFASGTVKGATHWASRAATVGIFARFSLVQDALGDACLPELEPPEVSVGF